MLTYSLNAFSSVWAGAWSLTSLTAAGERWAGDVLRAACVHNDAWSWRPFTGAFVAEGLGERRERETDMA